MADTDPLLPFEVNIPPVKYTLRPLTRRQQVAFKLSIREDRGAVYDIVAQNLAGVEGLSDKDGKPVVFAGRATADAIPVSHTILLASELTNRSALFGDEAKN